MVFYYKEEFDMHMADALLSPTVALFMYATSISAVGYSINKIKQEELAEKKLPIMAVTGALVFAAQMINFAIPGTGSSGHIVGGILLAALLGGSPALLTIASILTIQCLFFADGGLLALGCNIFNMGVIPCLLVYPLVFRPLRKDNKNLMLATILSTVLGLQIGAFSVILETVASGISELPFTTFALLMQPIHLAIGLVEGIVTVAILKFVFEMRPEILESAQKRTAIASGIYLRNIILALILLTTVMGGGLSLLASEKPDGLEWAIERTTGSSELEAQGAVFSTSASLQKFMAVLPDYNYASSDNKNAFNGTTVSGIFGSFVTFLFVGVMGIVIVKIKKEKRLVKHER